MAETATQDAVRCVGVTKQYGAGTTKVSALRGVDLDVHTGELLMLVGPSGCGKTTLISVIAGILDRDDGRISVLGDDPGSMGPDVRATWRGRNVGIVFQAFNLLPTLTATDNAAIPLMILGQRRRAATKQAREALELVGLGDRTETLPPQLSGGEQQRVAIARALVHRPRLLVCDEPTSALDQDTGRGVMQLLRAVAISEDRALLVVTHDPRIFSFADRIAQMDDGRITEVLQGPNETVP